MADKLYSMSCDPICGFMVQSHDEDEVVELGTQHVKNMHPDKRMTESEMRSAVKVA